MRLPNGKSSADIFSRFDTISLCFEQTVIDGYRQTDRHKDTIATPVSRSA